MRIYLILFLAIPTVAIGQSSVDDAYAWELIERLANDPYHGQAQTDMQLIFRWMDESSNLMLLMNHPESNRIAQGKRSYKEHLQILYLAGIVRYLLSHPEQSPENSPQARTEGRSCMCLGYANLRKTHRVRPDGYIRRLCRKP